MKKFFAFFLICLVCVACGSGTTSVGNPDISPISVITIGRLTSGGLSTITIPLTVFGGSESDLSGASIDVTKNGEALTSGLNPSTYYSSSIEAVRFVLSGLVDGDELAFVITLSGGTSETYEGTVSDDADAEATTEDETAGNGYDISNFYGVWSVESQYWEFPTADDPAADNIDELIIGGASCSNEVMFNTETEPSSADEQATFSVSGTTLTLTNDLVGTVSITGIEFGGTFGVEGDYYFTGMFNGAEETFTLLFTLSCEIVEP